METSVAEKLGDSSQIVLQSALAAQGNVTRRLFTLRCDCCLQRQVKKVASVYVCACMCVGGAVLGPEIHPWCCYHCSLNSYVPPVPPESPWWPINSPQRP